MLGSGRDVNKIALQNSAYVESSLRAGASSAPACMRLCCRLFKAILFSTNNARLAQNSYFSMRENKTFQLEPRVYETKGNYVDRIGLSSHNTSVRSYFVNSSQKWLILR